MANTTTYSFTDLAGSISHPTLGFYLFDGTGVGSVTISKANDRSAHDVAADGSVDSLGNLAMLNTGKGGLTVNGIVNSEKSTVTNEAGALTVNGTYNYEDAKFTNNGEGGLIVNGTVSSTNAKTNS